MTIRVAILSLIVLCLAGHSRAAPLPRAVEEFFKEGLRVSPDTPIVIRAPAHTAPQRVYLHKGQQYRFEFSAPFSPANLKVEDVKGALMYSASPPKGSFVAPADGMYTIDISRPAGAEGKYVLAITQDRLVVSRDPPGVRSVGPGGLVINSNLDNTDPIDKVRKHRAKTFSVRMNAGKNYTIDMKSMQFDCFLRLENPAGAQIAFNDDGGEGLNSRIIIRIPADGVYRIICTSFSGELGAYELSVRETP